jgi:hypothetical protein
VRISGSDELDLGIAAVLANVRDRAEQVKSLQALYLSQPIPVHLYAQRFGINAYEGVMHLEETESVSIKCSHPDPAAFAAGVSNLETAKSIVLDLSAVATIRLLGIGDLLSSHEFVLSQDSVLELRETLVDDQAVVLRIIWRKYLNDKWRKVAPQRFGSHGHCKSLSFHFLFRLGWLPGRGTSGSDVAIGVCDVLTGRLDSRSAK